MVKAHIFITELIMKLKNNAPLNFIISNKFSQLKVLNKNKWKKDYQHMSLILWVNLKAEIYLNAMIFMKIGIKKLLSKNIVIWEL